MPNSNDRVSQDIEQLKGKLAKYLNFLLEKLDMTLEDLTHGEEPIENALGLALDVIIVGYKNGKINFNEFYTLIDQLSVLLSIDSTNSAFYSGKRYLEGVVDGIEAGSARPLEEI